MFFQCWKYFSQKKLYHYKDSPLYNDSFPNFQNCWCSFRPTTLFKVHPILFIGKLKPRNNFSLLSAAEAFQRTGTSHFLHLRDQSLSFEKQQLKRMKKNSQGFSSRPFLKVNLRRGVLFAHLCFTIPMKCYCFLQYIICTERSCS